MKLGNPMDAPELKTGGVHRITEFRQPADTPCSPKNANLDS